ncbi:SCO family protein [Granulicella tundricola]|uniref:Alkyl hydroperoxide reductase/ Thiol specific antioxidant/ Mal allergen n=1 Tax=Granulicella tundricola (strain ATCC BAA-1859 / DSM 23138 / MP5ACTX9) TaxID=1198114 RepID=E8WYS8_GRATM|nr:SCO family protein [Granulicella tundricola]ADW68764.1 alkyl hydroperoxide reductase/ Thiol specific antioxidant/ Mal allergen [Granulicella tundricola MP5ACTX9]
MRLSSEAGAPGVMGRRYHLCMKNVVVRVFVVALVCLGLGVTGCRKGGGGDAGVASGTKVYSMRGKILEVDPGSGEITVDHKAIPGFMDAMAMPYKLADASTISEMHVGDVITARVLVQDTPGGPYKTQLDHVVVVAQARPDNVPKVQYHSPTAGEEVPDFKLLNQSGKTVHLAQFKGKVLLLTFIYTRCPMADFCPRMSENFAEIDRGLAKDKDVYAKTHLLSVSFDPAYDTPKVLRSYGGAHTGRFTEEDFKHWDFAAPTLAELPKMEEWFDVGVTGAGDPQTLMHSLSTVLIGKDGKVIGWYPQKDWQVGEMEEAVKKAAGA